MCSQVVAAARVFPFWSGKASRCTMSSLPATRRSSISAWITHSGDDTLRPHIMLGPPCACLSLVPLCVIYVACLVGSSCSFATPGAVDRPLDWHLPCRHSLWQSHYMLACLDTFSLYEYRAGILIGGENFLSWKIYTQICTE